MKYYMFTLAFLCLFQGLLAQTKIDSLVEKELRELHVPGLAAAKVEQGNVLWMRYYGLQDTARKIPIHNETVFQIASLSKTITAAAIMQLHGKGHFDLDDDVNRFLPFRVANPSFPRVPITFRQLLRHRSSISDNMEYLLPFWENKYQGPDIPLEAFLSDYFATNGKHYQADKNFIRAEPDMRFEYTNMGYALLGYLVERIAKVPFDKYCKAHLFEPLGMSSTSWFPKDFSEDRLAVPYTYSTSPGMLVKQPQARFPDYPAGQLRCSLKDLATFLACWSNDGNWAGKQILESKAVHALTPTDMSLGFHTWFMYLLDTETPMYSHNGHSPGVSTYMLYDPFSKKGLVILMNGELSDYFKWRKLIDLLYKS